jgi:DNA-binding response OmpR family regulator
MAAPERSPGAIDLPVAQVLVIDDDPAFVQFVKAALEPRRITVRAAKDAGQALMTMQLHQPDFIILDVILPGESGFEICERIKLREEKLPVLFVTAIDMDDARDLAQRVGGDGYLVKPVTAETLLAKVQEVADKAWRRGRAAEPVEAEEEDDRIRFACTCGKRFKVSASHRGRSLTCPQCGDPLIVPRRSTPGVV